MAYPHESKYKKEDNVWWGEYGGKTVTILVISPFRQGSKSQ